MKKFSLFILSFIVSWFIYTNSSYYLNHTIWKQQGSDGRVYGDCLSFFEESYSRSGPIITKNNETIGFYLLNLDYFLDTRLFIYSRIDNSFGVYRKIVSNNHATTIIVLFLVFSMSTMWLMFYGIARFRKKRTNL